MRLTPGVGIVLPRGDAWPGRQAWAGLETATSDDGAARIEFRIYPERAPEWRGRLIGMDWRCRAAQASATAGRLVSN